MHSPNPMKFIVDINVGKLARWLRMFGYDTILFDHGEDNRLVHIALKENRIILSRDTQMMKRRVITTGVVKAVLISNDNPRLQIQQVIRELGLNTDYNSFSICLECNKALREISKKEVEDRVPPYVYLTQTQFVECPECRRIYWQGTHWEAMTNRLKEIKNS